MRRNTILQGLEDGELVGLGLGLGPGESVLVLLQKPIGPHANLLPIVLLSVVRDTLSHIVLSKIVPKVHDYLSPSQSGFRQRRFRISADANVLCFLGHVLYARLTYSHVLLRVMSKIRPKGKMILL